jgi:outer membrane immunogenic protein
MHTYKRVRFVLATAMLSPLILASAGATVAAAADAAPPPGPYYRGRLPPPPPPPLPLPYYNWTGLYVGVHAGIGWADPGFGDTASGFIGGGQIGYNFQINPWWVLGLEAEISGSGVNNSFATFGPIAESINWNSLTTLTPRLGYAVDNWLIYGKVGGAWANVSVNATSFGVPIAAGGTTGAFVAGIGAEYAFWNNWSAKIEYDIFDFGNNPGTFVTGNSVTFQALKFGVNYRFGGPGPWWQGY